MSKKVREEPQPEGKVAFEHIFREADPAKNKANGSSSNGGH